MTGSPGVVPPILCYHKVDTRFELGFTQIEPRVFRRQVETLARAGYRSLGSAELRERLATSPAPAGRVGPELVFTFDDGYAGLARHAFPVLADHGFRALVFVITDYVGRDNTWDVQYGWRRFAHLGWDDLARWQERGIEVHSHGATHARLTWLSDAQAADELARSREAIAARLGRVPDGHRVPVRRGGRPGAPGSAAQAGYRLGFGGPSEPGADPLALPRRPVYGWDRFATPLVMGASSLSGLGLALARFTSRCAVGTAAIQRALGRRYRAAPRAALAARGRGLAVAGQGVHVALVERLEPVDHRLDLLLRRQEGRAEVQGARPPARSRSPAPRRCRSARAAPGSRRSRASPRTRGAARRSSRPRRRPAPPAARSARSRTALPAATPATSRESR